MNPGRELDALIAEKVMGLSLQEEDAHENWIPIEPEPYSTDITVAWEVVKYFSNKPFNIWISTCGLLNAPHFQAVLQSKDGRGGNCIGTTVPHAICLAALKAIDHSFEAQSGAV